MEREMENDAAFINEVLGMINDNGEKEGEKILWFKGDDDEWHQLIQCEAELLLDGKPLEDFSILEEGDVIKDLIEQGCYNSYVEEYVPKQCRFGLISRREMWEAIPVMKTADFSSLKAEDVSDFFFYFRLNERRWKRALSDREELSCSSAQYARAFSICKDAVKCNVSEVIRPSLYLGCPCLEFSPASSLPLSYIITAFNALVSNDVLLKIGSPFSLLSRIDGSDDIGVVPRSDVIDENYRRVINGVLPKKYINPWHWNEKEIEPLLSAVRWESIPKVSLKDSEEDEYEEE